MSEEERFKIRLQLSGLAMQAMVERETSWSSKIASDMFYHKIAKHSVALADAVLDELIKRL